MSCFYAQTMRLCSLIMNREKLNWSMKIIETVFDKTKLASNELCFEYFPCFN